MFVAGIEQALIKRAVEDDGREVVTLLPNNFYEAARLLIDNVGMDTFICGGGTGSAF